MNDPKLKRLLDVKTSAGIATEFDKVDNQLEKLAEKDSQLEADLTVITEGQNSLISEVKQQSSDIAQLDKKKLSKSDLEVITHRFKGELKAIKPKDGESIKGDPGKDGKDADETLIIKKIEQDLPKLGNAIRDGLELLEDDERLDRSAIRGLDDYKEISKLAREEKKIIHNYTSGGGLSRGAADERYLKLDQTTPQTVLDGSPIFDSGLTISNNSYLTGGSMFTIIPNSVASDIVLQALTSSGMGFSWMINGGESTGGEGGNVSLSGGKGNGDKGGGVYLTGGSGTSNNIVTVGASTDTTSHSLAGVKDLLVAGKLEVDAAAYFDSSVTIPAMSTAGLVRNSAAGVLSGGEMLTNYLTPTAGSTVTISQDNTYPINFAVWTAGEAETVNISGSHNAGQILYLKITASGLYRTITLGTGFAHPRGTAGLSFAIRPTEFELLKFVSDGTNFIEDDGREVRGTIKEWYGTIATIPAGWTFCNGTNGAPDKRDKFNVGAYQDDSGVAKTNVTGALTTTGGAISHVHSIAATVGVTAGTDANVAEAQYTSDPLDVGSYDPITHLPPYNVAVWIMKL